MWKEFKEFNQAILDCCKAWRRSKKEPIKRLLIDGIVFPYDRNQGPPEPEKEFCLNVDFDELEKLKALEDVFGWVHIAYAEDRQWKVGCLGVIKVTSFENSRINGLLDVYVKIYPSPQKGSWFKW